jgi:quinohemoprotein ethanol dehydrogenase
MLNQPMTRLTTLLLLCAALTSCTEITPSSPKVVKGSVEHIQQVTTAINDHALANANATPGDWLSYGRNYQEDRYSPLTQINKENLNQLGLAWTLELGTKRGIQATPLVVDGIMFFSGPWSLVYAVDSRHGKILWRYDPKVPRDIAPKLCCGVVNRGLALYEGDLFVGTLDGRLVSIKAHDGSLNWQTKTVPENSYLTITGAPRVVKGRVMMRKPASKPGAFILYPATPASLLSTLTLKKQPRHGQGNGGHMAAEALFGIPLSTTQS